jgi:26S proteasome regulatory subunit N9
MFIIFRINPLSLVEILAHIVVQFEDKKEAIQFLEKTEAKVKSSNEAVALCKVLSGQILLEKLGDQEGTKVIIFCCMACNKFSL